MSKKRIALRFVVLAGIGLLGAGCAAKQPVDVSLKGTIQAADDVNPALDGRPSPLRIRIFQLRSADKFKDADFFALYDDPGAALGEDLLAREDMTLKPGDVRRYEGEFDPQTRYIGVIGAFRDINQARWLSFVEMPGKSVIKLLKRKPIAITASRLAIDVSVSD